MAQSLAFITHDGDLALATWDPETPGPPQATPIITRLHPALRGADGSAPLALSTPTWSPNGRRVAISLIYHGSAEQPGSALAVLDTEGRDAPFVIWTGLLGEAAMIAPGLPHYVNWSPDGEHLALLAVTATGMTVSVLDRRGNRPATAIISGAPIFFAWSAHGDALLIHHGAELMLVRLNALNRPTTLLPSGVGCQLPAWAPSGERFAFARLHRGSQSLSIMAGDGSERAVTALPRGNCALTWRPGREDIVFSIRDAGNSATEDGLWLVRIGAGEPVRLMGGEVGAFFCSPDGASIAFLSPTPIPGQSCWCVLEIRTRTIYRFAPFYESPELAMMLMFFEQYGVSHRLWSSDGAALVLNGRVPANGTPPDVAGNSIYVQSMRRAAHPVFIAAGALPSWRPA